MNYLPVFLDLKDRACLVVGGGVIAERKVRLLLRAGAPVAVVAPDLTDELRRLRQEGRIEHMARCFAAADLADKRIVIAATGDAAINAEVSRLADAAGIFCNAVDDLERSSFTVPAIVDRSPVVIAIGTEGTAPVLAQRLKAQIEGWLPTRIGALATQAGRWRGLVKKRFTTMHERLRFWQRFFDGPIAEHLLASRQKAAERALRLELIQNVEPHAPVPGEAYIVGAGPGDPGLVTLRGQQLIASADVVLHDRLVSKEVLDFARKDAEIVSVGKAAGRKSISQEEINALIVAHVRAGRRVCRLKGGDPFVFGRGGEEIQALADAGLPFQVVPGITAALGCAAYAGIPLTHRHVGRSVTFATATLDHGEVPDWSALAQTNGTLVLYMGTRSIGGIARQLIAYGLHRETPAAIVENGTSDRQRVVRGTLGNIACEAKKVIVRAPATIFIGATAGMGEELQWFAPQPVPPAASIDASEAV